MFIRAYLRASTSDQDASRAKEPLKKFVAEYKQRIASFYIENQSGRSLDRPELLRLLDESEQGDCLLIESVDRLTRLNKEDWAHLKDLIRAKRINIISKDLPSTHLVFGQFPNDDFMNSILEALNNLVIDVLAAMAYKDLDNRREKQAQGIAKAQVAGKFKGRKPNTKKHDQIKSFINVGYSINETAEAVGVSRSTVLRVKKGLEPSEQIDWITSKNKAANNSNHN